MGRPSGMIKSGINKPGTAAPAEETGENSLPAGNFTGTRGDCLHFTYLPNRELSL
jgi:hypothetical protein